MYNGLTWLYKYYIHQKLLKLEKEYKMLLKLMYISFIVHKNINKLIFNLKVLYAKTFKCETLKIFLSLFLKFYISQCYTNFVFRIFYFYISS
jgi:hypothetical protein